MSEDYEFTKGKLEIGQVNNLVGKLLTIVDGSFGDKERREAVKSMVKEAVWGWAKEDKTVATDEQLAEIEDEAKTFQPSGNISVNWGGSNIEFTGCSCGPHDSCSLCGGN